MTQKRHHKSKKTTSSNSSGRSDSPKARKFNYNILLYAFYLFIIAVFLFTFAKDTAADPPDYEWHMCGVSECAQGWWECTGVCGVGECQECCVNEKNNDDEVIEDPVATATEGPNLTQPPACVESISASSSVSGDIFSYTFSVDSCQDGYLDVYLKRSSSGIFPGGDPTPSGDLYLYQGRYIREYGSVSGSGERAAFENFQEICVVLGAIQKCG
ncbi:hypothetical protein H6503_03775 [Candidatus Woesearchaeota archaeon]|nr:hypothetical protein [Candidatus Woesearchaeota archaeon]